MSNTTGKYYIPVPSWTGTHEGAGTSIYHYMKNYNDAELILIRGPTNEALDAMVLTFDHSFISPYNIKTMFKPKFVENKKNHQFEDVVGRRQ